MARQRWGRRNADPLGSPPLGYAYGDARANGRMVGSNTRMDGFANAYANFDPNANGGEITMTTIPDEQTALVEAAKTLLRHAAEGDKPTLVVVVDQQQQVVDVDIRPFADVAALLQLVRPQTETGG